MRLVIQRVRRASVSVAGETIAAIGPGMLALVGVSRGDTEDLARAFARKAVELRIFDDAAGKMNRSLIDVSGEMLAVSQFTLYGDVRRGRRPSFTEAAPGAVAEPIFAAFCAAVEAAGVPCKQGLFGAEMLVELVNDGPVTIVMDSDDLARPRRRRDDVREPSKA